MEIQDFHGRHRRYQIFIPPKTGVALHGRKCAPCSPCSGQVPLTPSEAEPLSLRVRWVGGAGSSRWAETHSAMGFQEIRAGAKDAASVL